MSFKRFFKLRRIFCLLTERRSVGTVAVKRLQSKKSITLSPLRNQDFFFIFFFYKSVVYNEEKTEWLRRKRQSFYPWKTNLPTYVWHGSAIMQYMVYTRECLLAFLPPLKRGVGREHCYFGHVLRPPYDAIYRPTAAGN